MASRKEQKEQRRRAREAAERAAQSAARRRRRWRVIGGGSAIVIALAAVAVFGLAGVGGDDAETFEAKSEGLEERMAEAKLQLASDHFHPLLKVFVSGKEVPVPDDIGVGEGGVNAPLHKHPGDEQLHAEGVKEGALTLAQVMKVWGVSLSPTRLGPHEAEGDRAVRMWVKPPDAKRFRESREFGDLRLRDRTQIYLAYGRAAEAPIAQ